MAKLVPAEALVEALVVKSVVLIGGPLAQHFAKQGEAGCVIDLRC